MSSFEPEATVAVVVGVLSREGGFDLEKKFDIRNKKDCLKGKAKLQQSTSSVM
jgi:hypothetical protein